MESTENKIPATVAALRLSRQNELGIDFEENDTSNPRTWPTWKRVWATAGPALTAMLAIAGNTFYVGSIPGVMEKFQVSETLALAPLFTSTFGFCIGPIVGSSVAELFGRRAIMPICLIFSIVFVCVGGSSDHIRTMIATRLMATFVLSPCLVVPVGIINDVWDLNREKIGNTILGLFAFGQILGSSIGPAIGASLIKDTEDWRWAFWLWAILLAVCLLIIILIPETYKPEILRNRAKSRGMPVPPRSIDLTTLLIVAIGRPLYMVITEILILPTAMLSVLVQMILTFFVVAYPTVFQSVYDFSLYHAGLVFLSTTVGNVLGFIVIGYINEKVVMADIRAAAREHRPDSPETRLYSCMIGGVVLPISLFWMAWTARPSIHWVVPVLAGVTFGFAELLLMIGLPIYKNAVYGEHFGASVLGTETILRYAISAPAILYTVPMIDRMGFDWAMSFWGFLAIALAPVPVLFFKIGPWLRARSHYVEQASIVAQVMESQAENLTEKGRDGNPENRSEHKCKNEDESAGNVEGRAPSTP